ncbi:hypothetical protein BGS_0260 [Beggiatoa sp. SS]|nr:hypothetical protein BGS_0260 [Beggiatoa sp. SS]
MTDLKTGFKILRQLMVNEINKGTTQKTPKSKMDIKRLLPRQW